MKALNVFVSAFAATLLSTSLMAMPMLAYNTAGDTVIGVDNIAFDGVNYDTRFVDGSCDDLYSNCSGFSPADTSAIATAIVDEMIAALNDALFQYNGNVAGCENSSSCQAYLVFGDGLSGSFLARTLVLNSPAQFSSQEDNFGSFDGSVASDSGTYIVATLAAATVPLSPTWLLLLIGAAGAIVSRKTMRRAQSD